MFYTLEGTLLLAYSPTDGSKVKNRRLKWGFGPADFVEWDATRKKAIRGMILFLIRPAGSKRLAFQFKEASSIEVSWYPEFFVWF